jgi:hypothetical protein
MQAFLWPGDAYSDGGPAAVDVNCGPTAQFGRSLVERARLEKGRLRLAWNRFIRDGERQLATPDQ